MGQSGFDIMDNDEALDVQSLYFEKYNMGKSPQEINQWFREKRAFEFENAVIEDCSNFWLGLALCQWEVKALEPFVAERVKEIIDRETEKEDYGDDYPERKKMLDKFLKKISKEKISPKKPVKQKLFTAPFQKGDVVTYPIYDLGEKTYTDKWGLAVCIGHSEGWQEIASSMFIQSSLETDGPATLQDFPNAYTQAGAFGDGGITSKCVSKSMDASSLDQVKKIGTVTIKRSFDKRSYSSSFNWFFPYHLHFQKGGKRDPFEKVSEAIDIPDHPYSAWAEKILALRGIHSDDPRYNDPSTYREVADFLLDMRKNDESSFRDKLNPFMTKYFFAREKTAVYYMFRSIMKSAGYSIDALE